MQVTQRIQKWGNGTGVRLPKNVIEAAHLHPGQTVAIDMQGTSIVLTPIETPANHLPSLAELLRDVTPEKVGGELDWGEDRGREIIDA